ncbi:MAG: cell division protein FtsZ, partial [Candidatus Diapherotrites archaeon]|nr:cell division protein FtsZ [Candidatus Diapherotrites archaeon]
MKSLVGSAVAKSKTGSEPERAGNEQLKIMVVGAGGGGCNTINRLAKKGINGAQLIALNTDKQHLAIVEDSVSKILIGASVTRGLGAGGYPEIGRKAAEVSKKTIEEALEGVDMLFLSAGMGGGTGTGSAPVVAQIAKEQGAIVISVVTYPFTLE